MDVGRKSCMSTSMILVLDYPAFSPFYIYDSLRLSKKASKGKLQIRCVTLTLSPPNKLSSAKFLVCFNFQSASMLLKICEDVV